MMMLDLFVNLAAVTGWILKIYSWVHIAAFVMSWISADPSNTLVTIIYRSTVPLWNWVGEKLPYHLAAFAPILALMLVIFGEIAVPGVIRSLGAALTQHISMGAGLINVVLYAIYAALYIVSAVIGFIFFLAIIWFVFTLVNPPMNNPIVRAIMMLIDPLITPLQRVLPRARIDLSPLVLALIAFLVRNILHAIIVPIQAGLVI